MTRNRDDTTELRHEIGRRAWAEAEERARFHYDLRKAELLAEAGLTAGPLDGPRHRAVERRTQKFHAFIGSLLTANELMSNDELLDAIEPFLKEPSTANRIALIRTLKLNPHWLGHRLAEFLKFGG